MMPVTIHTDTLRAGRSCWRIEIKRWPDGELSWRVSRLDERMSIYRQQPCDKAPEAVAERAKALMAKLAKAKRAQPRAVQLVLFRGAPA